MNSIPKSDTQELVLRAKAGDKRARDQVICENMGLVGSIVKRFLNRGYDSEELFQVGSIGLIKAVDKFDVGYNVAFSTYAVPMIMGEIKRFLRDDGLIKVSRSIKELAGKTKGAEELLTGRLGRKPTVVEIAEFMQIEKEEVARALAAMAAPESLYTPCYEDENSLVMDKIAAKAADDDVIVNQVALKEVLDKLPVRERQVIILRYFKENTQSKIAEMLGISQVQVSRIEKKVLCQMKKMLE